jgi:hypothetical protein
MVVLKEGSFANLGDLSLGLPDPVGKKVRAWEDLAFTSYRV